MIKLCASFKVLNLFLTHFKIWYAKSFSLLLENNNWFGELKPIVTLDLCLCSIHTLLIWEDHNISGNFKGQLEGHIKIQMSCHFQKFKFLQISSWSLMFLNLLHISKSQSLWTYTEKCLLQIRIMSTPLEVTLGFRSFQGKVFILFLPNLIWVFIGLIACMELLLVKIAV